MSLKVVVVSATNVPNLETFGNSDPYTVIVFQGIKKQTQVVKDELNPVWNESFDYELSGVPLSTTDVLEVSVKDWERIGRNRLLGTATVPLKDLTNGGAQFIQVNVNLNDANKRPLQSKLSMKVSYTPPVGAGKPNDGDSQVGSEIGGTVVEQPESEEEEGGEEDGLDGGDAMDGGGARKHKGKKHRSGRRKIRSRLSNKTQDFQVRICHF